MSFLFKKFGIFGGECAENMTKSDRVELKSSSTSLECVHIRPKGVDASSTASSVTTYGSTTDPKAELIRRK